MYMSGGSSDLLMLLGADDFADYLNRSELSRSVSQHDQELMEQIVTVISDIEADKAQIESKKEERTSAKKTLASKQKDLKAQMDEVNQLLEEIEDKQEELDDTSAEAKAAMAEVDGLLADARKSLQAKIDAERAAAAAANANKKPGGSSSPSGGSGGSSVMSSNMFLWPVSGSYTITSPFGNRIHPIYGTTKFHKGTDIAGGGINGKPIMAVEDGVVLLASYNAGGYGNYVVLAHGTLSDGNGYETLYGHMTRYIVSAGQSVKRGQVIGYVGSTGASTGPHLHLEVHRNGSLTDPMSYFKRLG
ncbi:MAG: peptidoglycan DD-metalloendopeptidase family protein [Clostridiales bacterium]|nr:peptidoglycan DD-metalloendopeptidase family protein [Clostridiales bacterium]